MKLIVKKVQGEECTIEVQPSTLISEVKDKVFQKLNIPVADQKLLYLGRTLVDEQDVQSYPTIKNGCKLNLIVKKREGLYDVVLKAFVKSGMTDTEAKNTAKKFINAIQENFNKLSWDDVERLSIDCLGEETVKKMKIESEPMEM